MNTYKLTLFSNNINGDEILSEILLYDKTTLSISLSGLSEEIPPLMVKVFWGDGSENIIINEPIKRYKIDSIIPEILGGKFSKIYTQSLDHVYEPSSDSLYLNLSASIIVIYPLNNNKSFILPIKIRKNDFIENFGEVNIVGSSFTEDMKKEYQFSSEINNMVFESISLS
jgi:hypothetical protein